MIIETHFLAQDISSLQFHTVTHEKLISLKHPLTFSHRLPWEGEKNHFHLLTNHHFFIEIESSTVFSLSLSLNIFRRPIHLKAPNLHLFKTFSIPKRKFKSHILSYLQCFLPPPFCYLSFSNNKLNV